MERELEEEEESAQHHDSDREYGAVAIAALNNNRETKAAVISEIKFLTKELAVNPGRQYGVETWRRWLRLLGKEREDEWKWMKQGIALQSGVNMTQGERVLGMMCERIEELLLDRRGKGVGLWGEDG